ncbi:MAG: nuclear transport factor 2 family protein [Bradyrhizobium sp.]|uniref:nuclear transport factor 2 family protein n=1 Tax=Bradyrhizobium sp. TaxID=376 RepID=UPI0025B855EB|nr:nuclear transport factor 2 family protein [Bradyrhizobium sp.]MBI5264118.1 nuclear transport factor 2 family protein [Bradyrhizobium sp.]
MIVDDFQRLLIERECERLIHAYTHLIDYGEAARVADLFTDDGTCESPEATLIGRDRIRDSFQARQDRTDRTSRHVCTNALLNVIDERQAEGVVYFTLYRHDGGDLGRPAPLEGPLMVGEYRDRFVRTDAGWRFARRKTGVGFYRREKRT